ncbi:MAG: TVP38/TMEM64 family protein [Clostridiales bacterium]|nr:TVP38/TMEM64 family protein [Clostridiales bacterium]
MDKHNVVWDDPKLLKRKRMIGIASIAAVLVVFLVLAILLKNPLLTAIRDKASFRTWMQERGFLKYPLMAGIMALQVIIAFIPGEPIEIIAGYIFGAWGGLLLCLIGTALGSVLIILVVRKYGMRVVSLFVEKDQIENLRFFKDPKKRDAAIFLLFLIPGTPKDILTYLSGLVPIHLGKYLLLTSIARIPSIITSTMGGNMLGKHEYRYALLVFAVTMAITILATLGYQLYQKRRDKKEELVKHKPEAEDPAGLPEAEQTAPVQQPAPKKKPAQKPHAKKESGNVSA